MDYKKAWVTASLLFFTILSVRSQSYPAINETRPRIWTNQARLDWLTQHTNQGDCGTTYNDFLYRYNNYWITDPELYMVGTDTTLWTWTWSSQYAQWQSVFTVFLWRINQDPVSLMRCRFLARQFYGMIDTVNFNSLEWYAKETLIRTYSDAGSLLLDWCYDSLPQEMRQHLANSMFRMEKEFMDTYILSSAGTSYVSSHNALNCVQAMQNVLVLHNADGLSAGKSDTVTSWYQVLYDKWVNGFLPCYTYYRDDDGGWNWGAAYAMWSLTDQFKLFDNMYYGTTKNFYTDLPWVQESINQYVYFIQPDNYTIHLGDGFTALYADNVIYRHAAVFQDPRSQWMAQYYSQDQFLGWTVPIFLKLFYKDFDAPLVTKPNLPLNWWSDKVGLSVSRSSWESDATMVWFFNSPGKRAAHEHRDNNSFGVFHFKPLLIDAGYYDLYGTSHFMNYYTRTIAHNSICVYNPGDIYKYGMTTVSNDGGQIYSDALINYNSIFEPQYQRGKWIQYASGENYSYSLADAALSYDTAKLSRFTRRFLFFKPNKIIVLDHVDLKNVDTETRDISWIIHTVNQPQVSGNLLSEEIPDHIFTYNGRDYQAGNGPGTVSVRTLLPDETKTRLVGGAGYEYWIDGVNYPLVTTPDTVHTTPGNWRLEVRPVAVTDSMVFLHTISTGDLLFPSNPAGTKVQNDLSIGVDWGNELFLFSAKGDTGVKALLAENIPGERTLNACFFDLKKKDTCWLFVDNQLINSFLTGQDGIVQAEVILGPGLHTLAICFTRVSGRVVYENTAQTPVRDVQVSVWQNGGLLMQTVTDSLGIFHLPQLSAGQYQLTLESNLPWGGANSTDALIIMRHFVHIIQLEGLKLIAASVDNNQNVNSLDAFYVAKRFIQAINSFPSGDWYFESPVLNIQLNENQFITVKGICFGDVNASYIPE
ncbi:MAG: heparinase II/III family protein [Bacteroidetes bacterium]|nr:heparinase II/III family protein [Bacteroidota bacterium]